MFQGDMILLYTCIYCLFYVYISLSLKLMTVYYFFLYIYLLDLHRVAIFRECKSYRAVI